MIFSIIIPSFNQSDYIRHTLENVLELKRRANEKNIKVEILLFDNESNDDVSKIISEFKANLDYVEVKKDKGQYDAINKGIDICSGDYWTWLNTDDIIEIDGFLKIAEILKANPSVDYIYGNINYIDSKGEYISTIKAAPLLLNNMVHNNPGIYQPGSFFKSSFTRKIGKLNEYRCCFDYEYILRCLKNNAVVYQCDFPVANFRYYENSKTGALTTVFINEQLSISSDYGRKLFSRLTWISYLRLLKHKLFPRK